MLTAFASNLMLIAGPGSAVLVMLDWLLSTGQKVALKDLATNMWYWLAIQSGESYLRFAKTKVVYVLILILTLLYFFFVSYYSIQMQIAAGYPSASVRTLEIAASLLGLGLLIRYGYRFYVWGISGTKPFKLFRDLFGLSIFLGILLKIPEYLGTLLMQSDIWTVAFMGTGLNLLFVALGSFIAPLLVILTPTTFLMLALSILMLIFRTLQIIIARVAESDKGPVLAISALLTAVGVAVKSFSG